MTQMLRYDLLGAVKYPNKAIRAVEPGAAIAVLDRFFVLRPKPHNELYKDILSSDKNLTLVVHGNWAGPSLVYVRDHVKGAKRLAKRLVRIGESLGAMDRIWLSPFLERRNKDQYIRDCFEWLKATYPNLKLISSIEPGGGISLGVITEVHNTMGSLTGDYIWSSDGLDPTQQDIDLYKMKHAGAIQFGLWKPWCNGKSSLTDNTPPLMRNNWPTKRMIEELGEMYGSVCTGPPPSIPSHQLRFTNCNLWKPVSEGDGNLVVLLRGDWPVISWAEVKKRDGSWERMSDQGFSNPCNGEDRYTYRASHPGSFYAGKRKGGGVRFKAEGTVHFIPLEGKPGDRHD